MDEFVIVIYPRRRDVIVDGEVTAKTREVFIVETGNHRFSLAGRDNYGPSSQTHLIQNTTANDPFVVVFTQKSTVAKLVADHQA
jgi:hypothetical protein